MLKFQDIPQMSQARYKIDVFWDYLKKWLADQHDPSGDESYTLDLDPEFQRGYVWSQEQKIKYIEYVLRGGESGMDIYFNHPNWNGNMRGRMVIVDGKQRLSAVLDFLDNKVPAFGHLFKDFEDKLRMTGPAFKIHIGCLKTNKAIYEWYLSMNTGGTYHTEEEIEKVKKLIADLKEG